MLLFQQANLGIQSPLSSPIPVNLQAQKVVSKISFFTYVLLLSLCGEPLGVTLASEQKIKPMSFKFIEQFYLGKNNFLTNLKNQPHFDQKSELLCCFF